MTSRKEIERAVNLLYKHSCEIKDSVTVYPDEDGDCGGLWPLRKTYRPIRCLTDEEKQKALENIRRAETPVRRKTEKSGKVPNSQN